MDFINFFEHETAMIDLTIWKDKEFKKIKEEMDSLFKSFFSEVFFMPSTSISYHPSFQVGETGDAVWVIASLPGWTARELKVVVQGNEVEVSGIRHKARFFTHRIKVPGKIDKERTKAVLKNEMLYIILPKVPNVGTRQIAIKVTTTNL